MNKHVVVVTEGGPHIWAIVNALADRFGKVTVVLEAPESKKALILRRARKLGYVSAIGQLGTMVLIRLGKRFFASRADVLFARPSWTPRRAPARRLWTCLRPTRRNSLQPSRS